MILIPRTANGRFFGFSVTVVIFHTILRDLNLSTCKRKTYESTLYLITLKQLIIFLKTVLPNLSKS